MSNIDIDIRYDVRSDSNNRDPDKYSNTLKSYHKQLWSKSLPYGGDFMLNTNENGYLGHKSVLGEFSLSSDSIIHSYSQWKRMKYIIDYVPKSRIDEFLNLACTIGGYILFPNNKVDNLSTINQERGCNLYICDRFDLTLECIRLYYERKPSPLYETLCRYDKFFQLFVDFKGYCDFFLLQDLVSDNYTEVRFFMIFNGFELHPIPKSIPEYNDYLEKNISFINARNQRILQVSIRGEKENEYSGRTY